MPEIICNTPAVLIPQELFNEKLIQEYWNVLYPDKHREKIETENLGDFFLLYPKNKESDSVHEISLMYKNIREKYPNQTNAICLEVYENHISLLVLKECHIVYTGYLHFSVKEDIVYHLANVAQHFFEDISPGIFYYRQLAPKLLRLLKDYFEMNQL